VKDPEEKSVTALVYISLNRSVLIN